MIVYLYVRRKIRRLRVSGPRGLFHKAFLSLRVNLMESSLLDMCQQLYVYFKSKILLFY